MFKIQIQLDYFLASVNIHALIVCFQLEEMDRERVIFSMVSWQLFQPLKVPSFFNANVPKVTCIQHR